MNSLSVLARTNSTVLYEIPPGKPDPQQKCTLGEDSRSRVFQSAIKGASCWYYTFNFLRTRIGKDPCPELEPARAIEEICSQRRKELTAYDDEFPLSVIELYSKPAIATLQRLDLEEARLFLNTIDAHPSLVLYVREFLEQNTHKNLYEFLMFKRYSNLIEINLRFLGHFNTDIHKLIGHDNWKHFSVEKKFGSLDAYVRDVIADLYKLKKSTWKPLHGIDQLFKELKEKGPLMVLGDFGASAYVDPPETKPNLSVADRTIYAWPPGAQRTDRTAYHSVLIVGLKKIKDQALVYFIDSADPSDPSDRSQQKIYAMSFKNLTSNIFDITGTNRLDSKMGYAYYGNFRIKS